MPWDNNCGSQRPTWYPRCSCVCLSPEGGGYYGLRTQRKARCRGLGSACRPAGSWKLICPDGACPIVVTVAVAYHGVGRVAAPLTTETITWWGRHEFLLRCMHRPTTASRCARKRYLPSRGCPGVPPGHNPVVPGSVQSLSGDHLGQTVNDSQHHGNMLPTQMAASNRLLLPARRHPIGQLLRLIPSGSLTRTIASTMSGASDVRRSIRPIQVASPRLPQDSCVFQRDRNAFAVRYHSRRIIP